MVNACQWWAALPSLSCAGASSLFGLARALISFFAQRARGLAGHGTNRGSFLLSHFEKVARSHRVSLLVTSGAPAGRASKPGLTMVGPVGPLSDPVGPGLYCMSIGVHSFDTFYEFLYTQSHVWLRGILYTPSSKCS